MSRKDFFPKTLYNHTMRMRVYMLTRPFKTIQFTLLLATLAMLFWRFGNGVEPPADGTLELSIIEGDSRQPTSARIEVLDRQGNGYLAEDAFPFGGIGTVRERPWSGSIADARAEMNREFRHLYAQSVQFYGYGSCRLSLPPGDYRVRVSKGTEYKLSELSVEIRAGEKRQETIRLARWIDPKKTGWYSADAHLHIARPYEELNPEISRWMQAEDLHVAHLLQFGNVQGFINMVQYAHGAAGIYQEGDYLLASGQENPRTHMLGHTITLGASRPIHFPDDYLIYRKFWEEARRQSALVGYAHGGLYSNAQNGLAIDLPTNLLHFLEVMQFQQGAYYDVWYNILNTGFSIAPVAGTDYPYGRRPPGRERFYAKLDGPLAPLTFDRWVEAVAAGRTIVTNGPVLEFAVNGKQIGDELVLDKPGSVRIEGGVRFDPERDDVRRLELIHNGEVLETFAREGNESEIRCLYQTKISESGWLALRALGSKLGESRAGDSLAHTGAVYLQLAGGPTRAETPRARALARAWMTRLKDLDFRLAYSADTLGYSRFDEVVPGDYVRKQQQELSDVIRKSMKHFEDQAR